jgi:hypothetical protein
MRLLLNWTQFWVAIRKENDERRTTKTFYPHTDHYSIPSSFSFACHAEAKRRWVFRDFFAFSLRLLLFLLSPTYCPLEFGRSPTVLWNFFEGRPAHIHAVQDAIQQKIKEWTWLATLAQLNQNL